MRADSNEAGKSQKWDQGKSQTSLREELGLILAGPGLDWVKQRQARPGEGAGPWTQGRKAERPTFSLSQSGFHRATSVLPS